MVLQTHTQWRAYAALAAVCFLWGTTYLAIRIALESFPPATLVCIRYMVSGTLLMGVSFAAKARIPRGRELVFTALFGAIILGIGNGCLSYAEQWIPSGLAAMFITTSPFWMVGIEAALPGGQRLHGPTLAGMLVGLTGALLLVAGSALGYGVRGPVLKGFLIVQLGCGGWALGSILQKRYDTTAHAVVSGAVQQLATGLVFLGPVLFFGQPVRWSVRGLSAVAYLVMFGSIVGYSAYIYALQNLPVSMISLYNYVNPVVAVFLGFLFYHESFGVREMLAMLTIFTGVALVKRFSSARVRADERRYSMSAGGENACPTDNC